MKKRGAADTETRQSPSVTLSLAAPFLIDRQRKHDQGQEKGKDLFPSEDDLLLGYRLLDVVSRRRAAYAVTRPISWKQLGQT